MGTLARPVGLALVLVLPALAGCIGTDPLEADQADVGAPDTPADDARRILDRTATQWSSTAGGETTFTMEVDVPASAGALLPEVRYHLDTPDAQVTVEAEAPDGTTYTVAQAAGSTDGTAHDHAILPAQEGAWSLEGTASGDADGLLETRTVAPGPDLQAEEPAGPSQGRTVVAVVDTGVNPYHQAFAAPDLETAELPDRVAETDASQDPLSVPLREDPTYRASLRDDAGVWARLPDQRLVHFEGTRVLGYNIDEEPAPAVPVLDGSGHGTMTSHAVAKQNPDALVVMVTGGDYDDGVRWAADQPWIDLLSLSWGPVVNAAGAAEPYAFGFETADATKEAWGAGKLVFSATGNDPTHAVTDTTSGPPWVHSVSGSQADTKGRAFMSGNGVDTVANWTQDLAHHRSVDETVNGSGTSFATPLTAGVASRILTEVRQETGHQGGITDGAFVDADGVTVTNGDLREALNHTAVYWDAADYGGPTDPGPSVPVAPAAPWLSMGWGHVDGRVVDPAVDALLGEDVLPEKPDGAEAYMEANHDARQAYWADR